MTGAHELFWYVRADSKIRSLKEGRRQDVAFSAPARRRTYLLTLLKQAGSKAKPTPPAGSRHAHLGDDRPDRHRLAVPPFALRELQEGKIVIIARAARRPS